ncbi:MAG: hypothetical protein ACE5KS_09435 [Woeseiaceae bacterium]
MPKILLLALALGAAPQLLAGQLGDLVYQVKGSAIFSNKDERDLTVVQSNGPSLSEAVEMVKRQCKCRIVRAWTETRGGREVHHIRFMTKDGTVKTTKIPGRTRKR